MTLKTKPPKPRKCKAGCGVDFVPQRMGQTVCGPMCGLTIARAKRETEERKKQRAETKAAKARLAELSETVPKLLKAAQIQFNRYVRLRDNGKPCISCGEPLQLTGKVGGDFDAGHWRSVGAAGALRFHADNCHGQCRQCNNYKAGNAVMYRAGLIGRIGLVRVEALESANAVHKWTRDELKQVRAEFKAKGDELERQK